MPTEPTLSEVHADLVGRLEQDKRLRAVEQQQAATNATMIAIKDELVSQRQEAAVTKAELLKAIEANGPKPVWPAVSAIVAAVGLILVVAASLYGQ